MPYKSDKQRAYLHIHEPEIAARWDAEMKDHDYHNSRNFDADTYDRLEVASAMPFVSPDPQDPHTEASWGSTGDADFAAPSMDITVHSDGSVTTRAKAGPANESGRSAQPGV